MKSLVTTDHVKQLILPTIIIIIGVLMRLVPHMPNFAPVTAIALFGGLYLEKKYAIMLPLVIMLISDWFIGFHDTVIFVYLSFILSGLLGLWARKQQTAGKILFVTLLSSVLFFFITNIGVWLVSEMYSDDLKGLESALIMALPFFRNTLFGDLLYTTAFILLFEFLQAIALKKSLREAKQR